MQDILYNRTHTTTHKKRTLTLGAYFPYFANRPQRTPNAKYPTCVAQMKPTCYNHSHEGVHPGMLSHDYPHASSFGRYRGRGGSCSYNASTISRAERKIFRPSRRARSIAISRSPDIHVIAKRSSANGTIKGSSSSSVPMVGYFPIST